MKTEEEIKALLEKYKKVINKSNDGMVKFIYAKRIDDLEWVLKDGE